MWICRTTGFAEFKLTTHTRQKSKRQGQIAIALQSIDINVSQQATGKKTSCFKNPSLRAAEGRFENPLKSLHLWGKVVYWIYPSLFTSRTKTESRPRLSSDKTRQNTWSAALILSR